MKKRAVSIILSAILMLGALYTNVLAANTLSGTSDEPQTYVSTSADND